MPDDLKARIRRSLANLTTLEIITAVGHVRYGAKDGGEGGRDFPDLDYDRDPKVMLSKIDLLQGDIKTIFNEEFVTGNYQGLRDFHEAREKEGHEIIRKNMEALERLWNLINAHGEE